MISPLPAERSDCGRGGARWSPGGHQADGLPAWIQPGR